MCQKCNGTGKQYINIFGAILFTPCSCKESNNTVVKKLDSLMKESTWYEIKQ